MRRVARLATAGLAATAIAAIAATGAVTSGCATFRPMFARPGDADDYRAFRVAEAEGTRLARAKRYLDRHPKGVFTGEVRAAFEEEEPRFFEASQASREGVRRYLADLPDGPHASAAIALLTALGSDMQDAELRDIARRVRYEDAKLETAAVQRRAVGEAILGSVGVLIDEQVYGVRRGDGPPALRALMMGPAPATWGAVSRRRERDLFFLLPTRPERESRVVTLEVTLLEEGGLVMGGRVEGDDMFVLWAEADQIVKLDPSAPEDRTEAQVHAMERLSGAIERRFPAASCPEARDERELLHRACAGWEVVIVAGTRAGDKDVILVRGRPGPATKQPDR